MVFTMVFEHILWLGQDGVSDDPIIVHFILPTSTFPAPDSEDTPKYGAGAVEEDEWRPVSTSGTGLGEGG